MARKSDAVTNSNPDALPHIECAHTTCTLAAKVKVLTLTGWAKFCLPHYERYHDDLARKRFTELDLDCWQDETKAEWRKRVFAYIRKNMKPKTFEDAQEAA
jgi:hypothetical protein